MATFVLVSGAWHAGWCWELISPLLEARGHNVVVPELLGMGQEMTPLGSVTLEMWVTQVSDIIIAQSEPVVMVGHSRGGIIISECAERVPDQIFKLVYLAAFLLPDGETLGDAIQQASADQDALLLDIAPDGSSTIKPETVEEVFYNLTPPELVARAAAKVTPEPMIVFETPLSLSQAKFGTVSRAYIECALDRAVPLPLQKLMHRKMRCDPIVTLKTDHSPFYSAPEALVDALESTLV